MKEWFKGFSDWLKDKIASGTIVSMLLLALLSFISIFTDWPFEVCLWAPICLMGLELITSPLQFTIDKAVKESRADTKAREIELTKEEIKTFTNEKTRANTNVKTSSKDKQNTNEEELTK